MNRLLRKYRKVIRFGDQDVLNILFSIHPERVLVFHARGITGLITVIQTHARTGHLPWYMATESFREPQGASVLGDPPGNENG
ncbi:hypothetical protein HPB48_021757 [Haemaphysalis longicornis]|uniref:Uncharacterized protein n=1 Tax=Haemaphysalis longicornis TaxID=44386 RepID=A0A9J6FVR8_HAELO|nr:hypothetical protein HPB48_021757 [Haemaphysalis longicornis]